MFLGRLLGVLGACSLCSPLFLHLWAYTFLIYPTFLLLPITYDSSSAFIPNLFLFRELFSISNDTIKASAQIKKFI